MEVDDIYTEDEDKEAEVEENVSSDKAYFKLFLNIVPQKRKYFIVACVADIFVISCAAGRS